jgi:hypothetical protein
MARVYGEYEFPDGRLTRAGLRFVFLDVVREHVPIVLETLFGDVLPLYRHAAGSVSTAGLNEAWLTDRLMGAAADYLRQWKVHQADRGADRTRWLRVRAFGAVAELHSQLVLWATSSHLRDAANGDRWILKTALCTLDRWYEAGTYVPRLEWWHPGVAFAHPLTDTERQFKGLPLTPGGATTLSEAVEVADDVRRSGTPDLLYETRRHAENRLLKLGVPRAHIRAELNRQSALYEARGMVRTSEKRPYDDRAPARHFVWLALYQCAGWSPERIAEAYEVGARRSTRRDGVLRRVHTGRQAVSEALHDTAALIGLELRRVPRGRPRKSTFGRGSDSTLRDSAE